MSPNVVELDGSPRKRSHDDFAKTDNGDHLGFKAIDLEQTLPQPGSYGEKENNFKPTSFGVHLSPLKSSPASLTDSGSSPFGQSPSPNPTPTRSHDIHPLPVTHLPQPKAAANSIAQLSSGMPMASSTLNTDEPPTKRKRITKAEKATKDAELAQKKAEKEAIRAAKAEKEAQERQKKEVEKAAKAAERAQRDAEKQRKADEKERDKKEKEEEEARKARSQMKLNAFFKTKPSTPKKEGLSIKDEQAGRASPSPLKAASKDVSVYEQLFKPFFQKEHVTLAPIFDMDDDARETKSRVLDDLIKSQQDNAKVTPFNPVESLQLPCLLPPLGRICPNVRKIMAEFNDNSSSKPVDLTTESQNTQIRQTRHALAAVPMKILAFKEDVRPPYFGTVTNLPSGSASLRRLARKPLAKTIVPLNYEYDSEAEWQEEDGEDVDDLDDEEEEADNEEEMDDFLDDSEDAGPARPAFSTGMEPDSTGLCWEDRKRLGPLPRMYKFRMEFILESLPHHAGIDPFSSSYWEPVAPPPIIATSVSGTVAPTAEMPPPPAPTNAFEALVPATVIATTKSGRGAPRKATALSPTDLEALKVLILENLLLSRSGTIDLFSSRHPDCSKATIKAGLDTIAEKAGKSWKIKADV